MTVPPHYGILLHGLPNIDLVIGLVNDFIDVHGLFVGLSWLRARSGIGRLEAIVVTIVRARFQQLAETLAAGYVAQIRGRHGVCIVHEG